jgi:SNF2 family DNA or RNA helicase
LTGTKTEVTQNCLFSEDEQKFYKELETKSQVTFNKYFRAGTIGKNYSHVLVLLLRLRQAYCHPHLNMDVEYAGVDVPVETMEDFAKRLDDAVVARLKASTVPSASTPLRILPSSFPADMTPVPSASPL